MPRPRTSPIYNHYKLSDFAANCKLCTTVVTYVTSANLEKHLREQHKEEWKKYEQEKQQESELPSKPKSTPKKRILDPNQPALSFKPPSKRSLSAFE